MKRFEKRKQWEWDGKKRTKKYRGGEKLVLGEGREICARKPV